MADHSTETVDVERLTKAMEGVAASMQPVNEGDDHLSKALAEAEDIVEAVTRGADALLVEFRQQNEAMAKGMLALAEHVETLTKRLDDAGINKSMTGAQPTGAPLRKSVDVEDVKAIPHPSDHRGMTRGDFIAKAVAELSKPETTASRRHELSKAIALAESGGDLTGYAVS